MFAFRSIKHQITFTGGLSLLLAVSGVSAYCYSSFSGLSATIQHYFQSHTQESTAQWLETLADEEAQTISRTFEQALTSATTLSQILAGNRSSTQPLSREAATQLLRDVLDKNPDFLSVYSGWEKDAFDGNDLAYSGGNRYSQKSGNFAPYWNRGDGTLDLNPLGDYYATKASPTGIRASEWYLCPMESLSACAVDPSVYTVKGQQTLLSSFVVPVISDGKFQGLVGIDYSLNFLQQLAQQVSGEIFNGNSRVRIISPRGIIAADSGNNEAIGKTLSGADTEQIRQMLQQGKTQVLAQQGNLLVFAPISLRGVQQKWGVVLDVSEATALAKATAAERAIADEFRQAIWIQLLVGLALALFGMLGIGWAARAIAQPLNQVVAMLRRLSAAGGDLTQRLDIRRKDETGELAREVNQLISHIHSIVTDVAGTTLTLQQAAGNSAVSSQQALRRTQLQLQEIEQIAAAVNEMSSTAHSVTDSAQMTASAVEQTRHAVERGQHVVNDTASSIQQLSTQVDSVAGEIQSLELQSQQIGTILDVIRNISDQTNLLALNAAIEAARAGEHGRGFAVVADEVRGLASKTQHSTTEIQAMIDSLRQTTSNAVATMSEGRQLSQQALNDIAHAVNALDEIVTAADQIQDMTTQIASAAEEQFAVTEDINRNIVNINQAASEVADGARKNNSDTQHMNELTAEVMTNLSRFRY